MDAAAAELETPGAKDLLRGATTELEAAAEAAAFFWTVVLEMST